MSHSLWPIGMSPCIIYRNIVGHIYLMVLKLMVIMFKVDFYINIITIRIYWYYCVALHIYYNLNGDYQI